MPRGDGTGPQGKGPGTGRSLGKCQSKGTRSEEVPAGRRQALGLGLGRGKKRGFGRGKEMDRGEGK